jgi:PKD repeat protein
LSIYAGETDVKIAFRYSSNSTEYIYAQEFSIDDIFVYGSGGDFECSPGVPYEISWDWNNHYGVTFHGSAKEGDPPYLDWLWDFGDNHTSKLPYVPNHRFDEPGLYNVSLTVKDFTDHVAFNRTTVKVIVTPPPEINVDINGGFGINAVITNGGTINVTYIHWEIVVQWGPLKMFEKVVANGTIVNLEAKSSQSIESGYFFGFGRIMIMVNAEPENAIGNDEQQRAFKIGPFVIGGVIT